MTPEEKQAIQTVLLQEFSNLQREQPTLLLDVLLSGQGFQFVYQVVAKHNAQATQATQITQQLLQALRAVQAPTDEAAA